MRDLPATITRLTERLSKLTTDESTATAHGADPIVIGNQRWSREDAPAVLAKRLDAMPGSVRDTIRVSVGTYRGLQFGLVLHPSFPPDVYLEGAITRQSTLSRDHQGPRAVLNALERLATGYGSESVRVRQDLAIAESQLWDYRERLGKPFPHEAYLSELTGLRDQLKAKLSASGHDSGEDREPMTSELAERIKTIKASHTIEATPQRTDRKQSTAEEPITARIRRRHEETVSTGETGSHEGTSPDRKAMSFQERILRERQQNVAGEGQSPS